MIVAACGGADPTAAPRVVERTVVATPTPGNTPTPQVIERTVVTTRVVVATPTPQPTPTSGPKGASIVQSFKNFKYAQNPLSAADWRAPARTGGVVNIAFSGTILSRDTTARRSFTVPMGSAMAYSRLVRGAFSDEVEVLDTNGNELKPDLAESWKVNATGDAWTFKIRKGVKWQNLPPLNGREFTPEDAAFSVNALINGKGGGAFWAGAVDAEVVGDDSIQINLKDPYFSWVGAGPKDYQSWMLSPEVFEQDGGWNDTVVGTGAFIQTEFDPSGRIKFERNPDFWREGKPYVDEINVFIVKDAELRASGMFTGQFDEIHSDPQTPVQVRRFQNRGPDLRILEIQPYWGIFSYSFRLDKEPYSDVRFRRAFALAVDWQLLIDTLYGGAAYMGPPVPWNRVFGDDPVPTTPEAASPWFRFDIEESKRLLAELGIGPDNPMTVPFLSAPYGGGNHTTTILAIKDMVKDVGLDLEVDAKTDFGAFYAIAGVAGPPTYGGMSLQFQSAGPVDDIWWGGYKVPNKFFIDNPEINLMRDRNRSIQDDAELQRMAARLWEIERDQLYRIPAPESLGFRVSSSRLRGFVPFRVDGEWPHQGAQLSEVIWLAE